MLHQTKTSICLIVAICVMSPSFTQAEPKAAQELYAQHCARCHGATGDGQGPAGTMQRPWPRDFTSGQYKFRSTPLNTLPIVEDVEKLIARGNLRTSMPPYGGLLSAEEITSLAQYVLNISKSKSDVPKGVPVIYPKPDHLNAHKPSEVDLREGEAVYQDKCSACHGDLGRGMGAIAGFMRDQNDFWVKPPDLTDALEYGGGSSPSDIFTRLKTGIATSKMPLFDGILSDDEMEKVSLYVHSLQVQSNQRELISKEKWNEVLPREVRGEYMVRAMSCALCHNSYDETGQYYRDLYMAGGVAITLPGLGVFYTKNITSHPEDGLAEWTEEEVVKTITTGHAPNRRLEAFSMPWIFFSHLSEEDASDVAAYVKSLKPIQNRVPERVYYSVWKRLWSRMRQLLRLEYGRLEYPPFNQGERDEV